MLGLQTALPIAWEVLSPRLGPERVFALMSTRPAGIARLTATDARVGGHSAHGGPVEAGAAANLCVFDPDGDDGRRSGAPGQPEPQHALRRAHVLRCASATRCCGASRS